jgi:DNA-binding transcriptional LysR family regulator
MNLQAVDTHLVVALHALLAERSVTRAARRVGITQPSMSHALARLRSLFDDALLVRVGRQMKLSARARELVPKVAAAIEHLSSVFDAVDQFVPAESRRTFRLLATDNLQLLVFPRLADTLASEAPHVKLRCGNIPSDWADRLLTGEFDLKLGRDAPVPAGCRSKSLTREVLVCVMRRGHPAASKRLTAARYAALSHLAIAPHGEETTWIDRSLAERGLDRHVAMAVPQFLVAPFIVAESDMILTVSSRVAKAMVRRLGLVIRPCPLAPAPYQLTMLWPAALDSDAGHRWLRAAIQRAVAEPK